MEVIGNGDYYGRKVVKKGLFHDDFNGLKYCYFWSQVGFCGQGEQLWSKRKGE